MALARLALAFALVVLAHAACGHKGPPLPPRLKTPPTIGDFRLAQRGDALEMSLSAPTASVEGVALDRVEIELFWGEGFIDLEEEGEVLTLRTQPGAPVVETVPLPGPGTIVRAAARAVAGRDKGQRSLILALETHDPLGTPFELTARLRSTGVGLNWRGQRPEKLPPPDLSPLLEGAPPPSSLDSDTEPAEGDDDGEATSTSLPQATETEPETAPEEAAPPVTDADDAPETSTPESGTATEPADESATVPEEGDVAGEEPAEEPVPARSHGFRVYRRSADQRYGVPLNYEPQERRLYTDTTAPLGSTVCYVIRAVGSTEPLIESDPSNEVCLEVRDISPPSPPTGLAIVPRGGGLEVVWSPSAEADLGGYRIYRAAGQGAPERVAEVQAGTTAWLDETTQPGALYRYQVTAFDSAGNEGPPSGTAQGRGP